MQVLVITGMPATGVRYDTSSPETDICLCSLHFPSLKKVTNFDFYIIYIDMNMIDLYII